MLDDGKDSQLNRMSRGKSWPNRWPPRRPGYAQDTSDESKGNQGQMHVGGYENCKMQTKHWTWLRKKEASPFLHQRPSASPDINEENFLLLTKIHRVRPTELRLWRQREMESCLWTPLSQGCIKESFKIEKENQDSKFELVEVLLSWLGFASSWTTWI